jgi:hypothetical protein
MVIQDEKVQINYTEYSKDIEEEKTKVKEKLVSLDNKLVDLELKERMINNIITRTNATLENMDSSNFKWMAQTQTNLMKQIENLGLVKDIIIKYEDMILKYRNILINIAEKKITNRVKIANLEREEEKQDNNITELMSNIQDILAGRSMEGMEIPSEQGQLFLSQIEDELEKDGY